MRVKTICPFCAVGCGLIWDGKKIKGDPEHPVSKGKLCVKGLKARELLLRKDRITSPLLKTESGFRKISWKEAIEIFCKRMKEINTYGEIATFASSKCTNEENYLVQKIHRIAFQNNNIDNCARLCHSPSITALNEEFGVSAMMNSFEDLKHSDIILIMGANPATSHPVGFQRILESKARKITVDVYRSETAKMTEFVRIHPNTDHLFIAGMIKHVFEEGLVYEKSRDVFGFELLERSVKQISWKLIERKCGVEKACIKEIADQFAKGKGAIIYGMGITQKPNGVKTILYMGDLCLITDNVEYPGTGINPLRGHSNVQGCCDMGCLPNFYPGYSKDVEFFEEFWKTDLPHEEGLTETEVINEIPYSIKALWIIGENTVRSHPDSNKTKKKLGKLDFLVVQDIFMTPTAELADLVIPGCSPLEKTGTITNTERRVQVINKIFDIGVPEEWIIIKKLGKKLGCLENYPSVKTVFNEIRTVVTQYRDLNIDSLKKHPKQWGGRSHLFLKKNPVIYPIVPELPRKRRDEFVLISVRSLTHFNTDILTKPMPEDNIALMSEEDMNKLNIKEGQKITIYNKHGSIEVKVKSGGSPGIIITKSHYGINTLTGGAYDPSALIPAYKYTKVKIKI
jgi:predicted molibdopterin-dependent oxidoreductase YjgC